MKEALSSSKRRFLQEPHSVTSQKIPFFIATAVKTSNLTGYEMLEIDVAQDRDQWSALVNTAMNHPVP
jgi:hypothetical protein